MKFSHSAVPGSAKPKARKALQAAESAKALTFKECAESYGSALWMGAHGRELRHMPAVNDVPTAYLILRREGLMIKTPKGEVSFWVLGGATVVLATWQFALLVSS